ncbi:hypothetical protein, partial [Roseixanthobacter pseudopolyaromaticivorans]|uniref:hypothetical protein n=1 Tax=Xanthobacteraceae TaxID=335928 RepID=UPI0037282142
MARSEYGYKDRIFEQKYVLPEQLIRRDVLNQSAALGAFADPNRFFSAELTEAMGGMCDLALVAIKTVNQEPLTQAQIFFSNLDAQQDRSLSEPAPPDEMCRLQTGYFKAAYADDMSTDRQLADLAAQIRKRFAADWLSRAEAGRADIQLGAQRYARIQHRIDLLTRVGISVPKANLGGINLTRVKEALTLLANDDAYAAVEHSLSQLESDIIWRVQQTWLREGRSLKSPPPQPSPSGEAKPTTFEEAYKVFHKYLGECWDVPFRYRQSSISITVRIALKPDGSLDGEPSIIKQPQEQEARTFTESVLDALKRCAPYVFFPSDQYETWRELQLTFKPQDRSRSDDAPDTAVPERESAGQKGDAPKALAQATAAADALDAAQARVARARQAVQSAERRLQERSAAIQADQARRMQNLAMGMARGPS